MKSRGVIFRRINGMDESITVDLVRLATVLSEMSKTIVIIRDHN